MFDARAFIVALTQSGIGVDRVGDKLIVTPASKLTDAQRANIRAYKPALLWQLQHMEREVKP